MTGPLLSQPSVRAMELVGGGLTQLLELMAQAEGDPESLEMRARAWSDMAEALRFSVVLPLAGETSRLGVDSWQGTARSAADAQAQRFVTAFGEMSARYEGNARLLREVADRLRSTRRVLVELYGRLSMAGSALVPLWSDANVPFSAAPLELALAGPQAEQATETVLAWAREHVADLDRYLTEVGGAFAQRTERSFQKVTYEVPWFGGGRPPEWVYQWLPRWLYDPEPSLRIENGELVSDGLATLLVPSSAEAQALVTGTVLMNTIADKARMGTWWYPLTTLPVSFARNLPTYSLTPVTDPHEQPGYMAAYNAGVGVGATYLSDWAADKASPHVERMLRRTGGWDWLGRQGLDISKPLQLSTGATGYIAVANGVFSSALSMKPYLLEQAGLGSFDAKGEFRANGLAGSVADVGYDMTFSVIDGASLGAETWNRTRDPMAVARTFCGDLTVSWAGTFAGHALNDNHHPAARVGLAVAAGGGVWAGLNVCDFGDPPPPPPPSGSPTPVEAVRAPYVPEEIPDPWLTWARDPELNPGLREDPGFQRRHLLNQVGTEAAFLGGVTVLSAGALTGVGALGGLPTVTGLGSSAGPLTPLVPAAPLLAF